jgi:hypothetical protein
VRAWFLLLAISLPARAALDVKWDCYLASGNVACTALESAFFSNRAYARAIGDADVDIEVRAVAISNGTAYQIVLRSKDGVAFTLNDRVPQEFSSDAVLLRVIGDLQKATAPLFVVDEPGTIEDGVLRLSLRDPDAGPRDARKDDESTGWYVAPSVNLNAERYGITDVDGNGFVELNWSHPSWRLRSFSWGNYRLVQAEDPTGETPTDDLHYENFEIGNFSLLARSWGGFSIAGAVNVERKPQNNYGFKIGSYIGCEWVLVPFLKTDAGNIGVNYAVGAEHYEFLHETVRLKFEEEVLVHALKVFGAWHFSRVDIDGNLNADSLVNDVRFASVGAGGSATWRILDDLSLALSGGISYRTGLVREPKDLSELHPLEQFYGGASYGDVTFETRASLQYVFGNSLIVRQDQRYKTD